MNNVLGIETSCDETAAALATDAVTIRAGVVASQADLHAPFGGVVPEIAARRHVELLPSVIAETMRKAGADWGSLHAVAVTYGPGLATSLLPGIAAAKGLALRLRLPLIGVNHLEAHLYSPFLAANAPPWTECMPLTALIVSGGHTCLLRADAPGVYRLLGSTLDDAAGEAFDKGAKMLGLGYPGGPAIEKVAAAGRYDAIKFPRGMSKKSGLNFSFSGLKTALRYHLEKITRPLTDQTLADIAAGYQAAIVGSLVRQTERALARENTDVLIVAGGVALNACLRAELTKAAAARSVRLMLPDAERCGDNAEMVAALAAAGRGRQAGWDLDANPHLPIPDLD